MNTNLLNIVKQIIATNGEEILENPQRLKAFFGDLAKDEPKPLRIAFGTCLENGAYNALKTAPDAAERASRKAAIAQRLRDDLGLDPAISGEALDILEAACVTAPSSPPRCKTCGKELQPEWKACPHCGDGTAATMSKSATSASSPPVNAQPKHQTPPSPVPSSPSNVTNSKTDQKNYKNIFIAAVIFGLIALVVSISVGYYKYDNLMSESWYQLEAVQEEKSQLQNEKIQLQNEKIQLEKMVNSLFNVTSIKVGNTDWGRTRWLTRPGENLRANDIRYLRPIIYYNSLISGSFTVYVKIIQPNGSLLRNQSISPEGYTYSTTDNITRGNDKEWGASWLGKCRRKHI